MEFLPLLQEFGPVVGVLVFFVWRDYQREARMCSRIETLEDEQRNVILPMVEKTTQAIAANTVVMERNTTVMERNASIMEQLANSIKSIVDGN